MTAAELAAVLTAAAGLVAAVTALIHSLRTASALQAHRMYSRAETARTAWHTHPSRRESAEER